MVTSYAEIVSTITVFTAKKNADGRKSTKKVSFISATNMLKEMLLTGGKPGINTAQFMAAIIDELSRMVSRRSTSLPGLQKLYENRWPPVDGGKLILFVEESYDGRNDSA